MKKSVIICLAVFLVYACKHEIITEGIVPTNLIYTPTSTTTAFGTAGSSAAPTIDKGSADITYTLTGIGVSGISINSLTGVISWSNIVASGSYNIIVTAASTVGSTTTTYSLTITAAPAAPTALTYSPASSTIIKGTAGNSATPTITNNGGSITYSLTGTIPPGITISSSTGVISWSNAVTAGTYTLNIAAANSIGSTSSSYTLTVNNTATVIAPSSLSYSPTGSSVMQGTAGASATPTINNGLGTITYSLTGTIPTGISINSSTGIISWSSAVAIGSYTLTVTATNSAGKTTATYALTVTAAVTTVSFSKDILPIMSSSCGGCHSYTKNYAGVSSHTTGCNSIQDKIGTTYCSGSRMPKGASALSAAYISLFNTWIAQGQLNN